MKKCVNLRITYLPSNVRTKLLDDMNRLMKYRKKIECSTAKDLYETIFDSDNDSDIDNFNIDGYY